MPNQHPAILRLLAAAILFASSVGAPVAGYAAPVPIAQPPLAPTPLGYAPGLVLVGLESGATLLTDSFGKPAANESAHAELAQSLAALDVRAAEAVFAGVAGRTAALAELAQPLRLDRVYRLRLPPGQSVLTAVEILAATPGVLYAEPDYTAHLSAMPDDPHYPGQWGLAQIGAEAAWDVVTGTSSVAIAVIDSGLDTTHPDLAGQLWTNPGEIPGNSLDDDNNGFVDDVNGWNLLGNNATLTDLTGHGTQVAGIIAAATDNAAGVAGVCWGCRLMVVKVTNSSTANYSDIAAGVNYAAQKGADVINLSLGGNSDSVTLRAAIAAAVGQAVVVGGAGNDDSAALFYPAAYPGVLAVAGTTISDTRVTTSNFGSWVDIAAPGEAITTTFSGGGYGESSGTSLAAPFAAGVAGLLRSLHPGWTAARAQAQIIQTAAPLADPDLGAGRLDAAAAVTTADVPLVSVAGYSANGIENGHPSPGTAVTLTVTLYNDWGAAENLQATLTSASPHVTVTTGAASYGSLPTFASQPSAAPFAFDLGAGAGLGAVLPLTLTLTADGGYSATLPLTLTTELATLNVSGSLSSQTWTADHIYVLTGNATVAAGQVLTIEAGTTVRLGENLSLLVAGTLIADADGGAPIRFERQGDTGTWDRVGFQDSSQDAVYDGAGLYLSGCIIRNVVVDSYSANGIALAYASPYVANNHLSSGGIYGYGPDGPTLIVSGNILTGTGMWLQDAKQIISNTVSYAETGILAGGHPVRTLVASNRLIANQLGVNTWYVEVVNNLFSGNAIGLNSTHPEDSVVDNTFVHQVSRGLVTVSSPSISGNNFVGSGEYAVALDSANNVEAAGNWWGTTNSSAIDAAIFDGNDAFGLGIANYAGFLTSPSQDAPAYVTDVAISPDTVLGIQTGTFDVSFSRPMDPSRDPDVSFAAGEILDGAQWLDDFTWRATHDFTALIPRDTYSLTIAGALGTDGIEIAPDDTFTFTVDYAGAITDQSAPSAPFVFASGDDGDPSAVSASWSSFDNESTLTGYRYAIGSAPGAVDIVNWTPTALTSATRAGLGLVPSQTYWVSVQSQNEGGLWSPLGMDAFVAGETKIVRVYLPLAAK